MDAHTKKIVQPEEGKFVERRIYQSQSSTADTHVAPADADLVGQIVARRYRIEEIVGHGGMGIVYRAHDNLLNQEIALKMLHTHLLEQTHLLRFRQEARAAKRLSHPGIVRVFDFGVEDNGRPYISMEYAKGTTLAELLEKGALGVERSLEIARQVAEAVKYAHEQGILHRDLKPTNIIVTESASGDLAQILDFGIAKLIAGDEESAGLTQTGETLGSPLYMSPEQCQGGVIDGRTDVFALGCVLYHCLTGSTPVAGKNTYEIIFKQINEMPSPLTSFPNLKTAHAVDAVVSKALEKQPERRHQSMDELIGEIQSVQNATDSNPVKQFQLRILQQKRLLAVRLNKNATAAIALIVVLLVVALSATYVQHQSKLAQTGTPIASAADVRAAFKASYDQGKLRFQTADYRGAVANLDKARQEAESIGDESDAYFDCLTKLAEAHRQLKDDKQAASIQDRHDRFLKSRINFGDESQNAQIISQLWIDHEREPNNTDVAHKLVTVQNNQASLLYHRGQLIEAEKCCVNALTVADKLLAADDPQVIRAHGSMARVRKQLGKTELARQDFEKVMTSLKKTSKGDIVLAYSWGEVADYLSERGDTAAATEACQTEIEMAHKVAGAFHPAVADALCSLGRIDLQKGNFPEAIDHFKASIEMYYQTLPPGHHAIGYPLLNLGLAYSQTHNYLQSEKYLQQAMTLFTRTAGSEAREVGECSYLLGLIRLEQHDTKAAEPLLSNALSVLAKVDPNSAPAHDCYQKLMAIYNSDNRAADMNRITNLMKVSADNH